ncbi:MAG: bifunctional demethylmenaquinone methyltransferase/2-methoxy-6-polyprenyl-1,4-benzoquinol methylase UbiE [Tannerellaceae bacterium]|jgi:demethylmenaquinone methyltransferase/2-methoxy-6-polyprenyl-1,4-benzoquinol methylase|nr:bifunctional demethylmenaquinone methyltransferase/2-methoxy-6-polyprenyl-1,4-benzoquinol methylase UbiE [Tannerellaceae bacterium]
MAYDSENIFPYNRQEQKGVQVERMFDAIAGRYDALNHLLSFGLDRRWRRKGIDFLRPFSPARILDVATGTGDLAIALYEALRPGLVVGIDLSDGMMEVGRRKAAKAGCARSVLFERQDCMALSYPDDSFDAVTVAFGVRNFAQIARGIAEMYRVLKPGGRLLILELSTPRRFPMKQLYALYSKVAIPRIGRLVSKERAAYAYLPASIRVVPQGGEMAGLLAGQGFEEVGVRTFTFGICSLYTGKKN